MVGSSVRLFRVAGIDVGVHVSWLVIFVLVTWSLATGYFPVAIEDVDVVSAWVLGVVASLLLFASVLVHELAHSLVARRRGLDARSITLFLFGGVSNLGGESKRPSTEFIVAIVGPISSFAIAGLCAVVLQFVGEPRLVAVLGYLALVNVFLGAFNLIPGFPLDGGRVLRAVLWNVTGNVRRATEVAAAIGQMVGFGLIAWGVFRLIEGDALGGIWIAAIGWFLQSAAVASAQQTILEQRLREVTVADAMAPDTTAVPATESVATLIERYVLLGNRRAVPVERAGRIVGMVTLSDIRHVPPEARAATSVGEIMGGRQLVTASPRMDLREAASRLTARGLEQLPVLEGERLVGVLTRADIMRELEIREALGLD
jgi:Zn-dependent protease